jgi:hypothetical protein
VENLVVEKSATPLIVGRNVHAGLSALYTPESSTSPEAAVVEAFKETREATKWLEPELQELALQEEYSKFIIAQYQLTYPTEAWTVLQPEVEGNVLLPKGKHRLFFRTDAIVSWKGFPWLLEHKTTSQMGDMFFKKFRLDGQITAYIYGVWKQLGFDDPPAGAIINGICKSRKLDKVSFGRDVVMRPKAMVLEYMNQLDDDCTLLEQMHKEVADDKTQWHMCTANCGKWNRLCDYIDLCSHDTPAMREMFTKREGDYVDEGEEV